MMMPVGAPGDLQLGGHGVRLDGQRVVPGRGERVGQPANTPAPSWCTRLVLPCSSSGARSTTPPNATPIACMPRHTPKTGTRPVGLLHHVDADAGLLGRARTRGQQDAVIAVRLVNCHGVVAQHLALGAQLVQVLDEVETKLS